MSCSRCQGLMVGDITYNHEEAISNFSIWRCLNCGETTDPVILLNRQRQGQQAQMVSSEAA